MTVQEFYNTTGGNYEEAIGRLMNDTLIKKFVLKFKDDTSFNDLTAAIESKNYDAAFAASHTLKGVSLNLAFSDLSEKMVTLTDALRPENRENIDENNIAILYETVKIKYHEIINCITSF